MKLSLELLPKSGMQQSLYQYFREQGKEDEWKAIKQKVFSKEGRQCWICDSTEGLKAHPFWEFNTETCKQTLKAIHHLCDLCHKVKRIQFWTSKRGQEILKQDNMKIQDVMDHFFIINECSVEDFEKHREDIFDEFKELNQYEWEVDLSLIK
jgi:hypothetical protein